MSACLVVAGIRICIPGESAGVTGFASGGDIIISSSDFFPSLPATLLVTEIDAGAFAQSSINILTIARHVHLLDSSCFSYCKSLSSISFETPSELTRIESDTFSHSSLKSITIPRNV
jgi:hypothetical protein